MRRVAKVRVKVWGDGALFTRPEAKVERVSYPIMTPSAARGVLESIFWKPEFYYRIKAITALKPPKFHAIVRNEVQKKATINKKFMKQPQDEFAEEMRQLRHSLYLKDVAYLIEAEIVLLPATSHPIEKYESMFMRRVTKGQCFARPYLGTREFSAQFGPVDGNETLIDWTDELGPMFFDYRYPKEGTVVIPYFFNAHVKKGCLQIPDYLDKGVNRHVCETTD